MSFTFLHTADWQIGKVFGQFEDEKAAILRKARFDVIDRIAECASREGARHVLVAGDVFDSETLSAEVIARTLARLAMQKDVVWHLIAGNHDPARAGGVWDVVGRQRTAENIKVHLKPEPVEMAPGVFLLPASLTAKALSTDPTAWMDEARTPPGALRIGMAHGSIKGFGSLGEAAVHVDPKRAETAGLAYLAMGDWHGMMQVGPKLWYSGTPEQDGYGDNKPGYVLRVRLDGSAAPTVNPEATSQYWWRERLLEVRDISGFAAIEAEVAELGATASSQLIRLSVSGSLPLSAFDELERRLNLIAATLFDLRIDKQQLAVAATDDDIAALGDSSLQSIAARLLEKSKQGAEKDRRIAALALQRLATLAQTAIAEQAQ